jgi:chemotaxis methyl-accepting protein methylase
MGFDEFLREVAPLLGLQWRPFQRKGIKRKVERRIAEISLSGFEEYLLKIKEESEERTYLSKILTVTISRFFRDREVFNILETSLIPTIVKKRKEDDLKIWSIGCASGEEPYSIALLWEERFGKIWPQIHLCILATDIDEKMIGRAKEGRYKKSSLKELPEEALRRFFKNENGFYVLDRSIRTSVEFKRHDIIHEEPFSRMDIIFCRNLAFTYFSKECQIGVLKKIAASLKEEGYLIIGKNENLPLIYPALFILVYPKEKIFQKFSSART